MKKKQDHIHWTDTLFVPATLVLSFVLTRWLPQPWASVLSFIIVSLVLFLFEPQEDSPKRFIYAMLFGASVTLILAFVGWPF
jgi:heme/copper-type cytochrome/quinol oxidase subunit 4